MIEISSTLWLGMQVYCVACRNVNHASGEKESRCDTESLRSVTH